MVGVGSPFTGAGFTIAKAMASAFPSRGIDDPAARLAVRSLVMEAFSPSSEVGGGVSVAVDDQAAAATAEGPLCQPHLPLHDSTP
jgi:hypothetical protein